jgi:hypothetical protein
MQQIARISFGWEVCFGESTTTPFIAPVPGKIDPYSSARYLYQRDATEILELRLRGPFQTSARKDHLIRNLD